MASATAWAERGRRALRHLARIRYRLLLINVIVAAVPLVGIVFARMHETQLLAALALHKGRVLSRAQLIAAVYGDDHHISARTIDTHVRNLRAKLAAAGAPAAGVSLAGVSVAEIGRAHV